MKGSFEDESKAISPANQKGGKLADVRSTEMPRSRGSNSSLEINLDEIAQLDLTAERSRQFFGGFFAQLDVEFDALDREEARTLIREFLPDLIRYQHSQRGDRIKRYFAEGAGEVLAEVRANFRRETDQIIADRSAIISEIIADFERNRAAKT